MNQEYSQRWPELKGFVNEVKEILSQYEKPANQVLLEEADALAYLKVSKRCLAKWRANGTLPFHRLGGKIYYIKSEILEALKKHSDNNAINPRI